MIPNLCIGNGWKSPFPSIYKWLALGFQAQDRDVSKKPVQAIVPPKINECPFQKRDHFKKKLHLPTIDFQGRTVSYY